MKPKQDSRVQNMNIKNDPFEPAPLGGNSSETIAEKFQEGFGVTGCVPISEDQNFDPDEILYKNNEPDLDVKISLNQFLTDELARTAITPEWREYSIQDTQVPGLKLRVRWSGHKTYVYRYRMPQSKPVRITIGNALRISVDFARERARLMAAQLATGIDPRKVRQLKHIGATEQLDAAFERYVREHLSRKSKEYSRKIRKIFKDHILDDLGTKVIGEVTRADIEMTLVRSGSSRAAHRVRATMSAFCDWCAATRLIDANPARNAALPDDSDDPEAWDPERDQFWRLIPIEDLALIWRASGNLAPVWRCAVRLMIASAQRRGEVIGAHWDNVDLVRERWLIRQDYAALRFSHFLPISKLMREQLLEIPGSGAGYLFESALKPKRPMQGVSYQMRKLRYDPALLYSLHKTARWTLRDIRPSVAEQMQRLGIKPHVIEAILDNRSSRHRVELHGDQDSYRAEMREALDQWGEQFRVVLGTLPMDGRWPRKETDMTGVVL